MNSRHILVSICAVIFVICLIAALRNPILHADEPLHYDQIRSFAEGHFKIHHDIATLPSYHFLMALPGLFVRIPPSPALIRFLTFCTGLLGIAAFAMAAKMIDPQSAFIRTLQFAFFPILFPMFFVIYTDILSLTLVLLAFLFTLRRDWILAGLFMLAATAIRQNNVIWALFLAAVILSEHGWRWQNWRKIWPLSLSFLLVAELLFVHHTLALGDQNKHPIALSAGNLYFFLFLSFFLLLPMQIRNAGKIADIFRRHKSLIFLILVFYVIGVLTFHVTHPYNEPQMSFYLRNRILTFFDSSLAFKVIFFIPATYALCTFLATRSMSPQFRYVLPFTVIFLSLSWLIEQRYYLIPFTLLLLALERSNEQQEYFAFGLNVFVALTLFTGIVAGHFFL